MTPLTRDACAAVLVLAGCAGGGAVRPEVEALRAEVRALHEENDELSRKVDVLSGQMDLVTARLARGAEGHRAEAASPPRAVEDPGAIPRDLAVVKIVPPAAAVPEPSPAIPTRVIIATGIPRSSSPAAPATPRSAPSVPTTVAIAEPDSARLDALTRPGRRALSAEADAELRAARRRAGLERAHALEGFAARYPRHGAADNALVEAAEAYASAGIDEAACAIVRRVVDEYPAGDAMSDALERLAACEARRGRPDAERRLLQRIVGDYPSTTAATRAGARLATISGHAGATPAAGPARSAP
ncbi:tetratricopeptide repeat protein [Anaeromyxobacter oryzisoli]|uniref:tetratricopeptide repeat protein n=1 Tax=Anaeromyxobacter oryzisoli TaxID=2925408 RepID=UPI001F5A4910|nr:tetratricopeptide repeat protein [Anaeromyxobacter sp. SG63]